jgi:hypothetical protein
MTQQRDLKRRIRERMLKTGESYVTARLRVIAERDEEPVEAAPAPGFDVVEPMDVSHEASALDLKCRAAVFPKLATRIDVTRALTRLRDALVGAEDDGALSVMRRLVLHGELPPRTRYELRNFDEQRSFVRRARAGIGGVCADGSMIALAVHEVMMICVAASTRHQDPIIYLQSTDEVVGQTNHLIAFRR